MSRTETLSHDDLPTPTPGTPALEITDLNVRFPSEDGVVHAVRGLNLTVNSGEVLGIVGESGSGKSVTSMSVMGLHDASARIEGSIKMHGVELLGRSDRWMSTIRGRTLAMVFQDPLSSLNPVFTIGDQICEALQIHDSNLSDADAHSRALELLEAVGIPNADVRIKNFPHEFSGGMRQRVMIAMAIANNPDVIIADEPTTALDVTIQAQILDLLRYAQKETGAAVIIITHDLGVVAGLADRVAVMYAGRIVETGTVDDIFSRPAMPYTIGLLGSLPRPDIDTNEPLATVEGNPPSLLNLPPGCPFAPRCPMATAQCEASEPTLADIGTSDGHRAACLYASEILDSQRSYVDIYPMPEAVERASRPHPSVEPILKLEDLTKTYPLMKGAVFKRRVGTVHAVNKIDLEIRPGETLGLVGESGCGKTTTLMGILELKATESGRVVVFGKDTSEMNRRERKEIRQDLQVVFQDPMASLDPRMPVSQILSEPLIYNGYTKKQAAERVGELMELVGLEPAHQNRYSRHFSGGQKQRIGIARALALSPKLLVLDEPVSALDVSIQAGVLNLLERLQAELNLSYLFVAHDLSVIRHIADRVAVMYLGRIVEIGEVTSVYDEPRHPYTQALLSAIPIPDPAKERGRERILLTGDLPSPANMPTGCPFRTRCPLFKTLDAAGQQACLDSEPRLTSQGDDHNVACHYARPIRVF